MIVYRNALIRASVALPVLFLLLSMFRPGNAQDSGKEPIRIIVVPSKQDADAVLERLAKGADFAELAHAKSTDPTAADGGYIGEVRPSVLRPELRAVLSSLPVGELSHPIQIPEGYAILQILEKPPTPGAREADPNSLLPLAARGTVKLSSPVSGYAETFMARRSYLRSRPGWEKDPNAACEARVKGVSEAINRVRAMVEESGNQPDKQTFREYLLGQMLSSEGKMGEAIAAWESAYKKASELHHPVAQELAMALGTAYLHHASLDDRTTVNGVDQSRIFPYMPGALHPRRSDLERAADFFEKALAEDPSNLEAKWLLNVTLMTEGAYPDKVPQQFLIALNKSSSQEHLGRFVDIAPSAGINAATMAGGIIVDDFDNDGLLDIVVSQMNDCDSLLFFHNNGDGTFTDRTKSAGLSEQRGGLNIIQADYNNDGCVDILVLRGGWELPLPLSLLRNNCNGTFTDVTRESGLRERLTATQAAVWTDIDNDGNLDLFVANENSPSQLFLNKGNGTFVDIASQAGVDRTAFSKGVVSADYDGDGYPDLYVSNLGGDNFLYHNNGNRTFTESAQKAHVKEPWRSFAAAFFDYDNDGLPDLFVASYYISTDEFARGYLNLPQNGEGMKMYKNLGNGTFSDVSTQVGLDRAYMPMGLNFGDVDNDGFLDLYLGNGNPSYTAAVPNILLHNKGGKTFVDVTTSSGTGAMEKGHGVAFADFRNSGQEDIAVVMGGAVVGDRHALRLFENPGNGNDWLTVRLVGVKSNRSAIGARIKVTVENGQGGQRSIYRTVGSGGSFGAAPLEQHIGLGSSVKEAAVEIWWPASNSRQKFTRVPVDQAIEIKEFASNYQRLHRKRFNFEPKIETKLESVKAR